MSKFKPLQLTCLRWLVLVALASLIPACGSDDGGGSGFQDLFIDDFDAGLGAWTIVSPSVAINPTGIGRGPSMHLTAQAGIPAEARTAATYTTSSGLSISFDVEVASSIADVQIVDNASPAVRDTYVLIDATSAHYSIGGQHHTVAFPADSYAHKFIFHVDNSQCSWERDGKNQMTGTFSAGTVFVDCKDLDSGSDIDLVHITTP